MIERIFADKNIVGNEPFEVITFFDGYNTRNGKKINAFTSGKNKFDVVCSENEIHVVFENISQICVTYESIQLLIDKINKGELKDLVMKFHTNPATQYI